MKTKKVRLLGLTIGAKKWLQCHAKCGTKMVLIETLDGRDHGSMVDVHFRVGSGLQRLQVAASTREPLYRPMMGQLIKGYPEMKSRQYITENGAIVDEFVQLLDATRDVPIAFIALRFQESGEIVKNSLWSHDAIQSYINHHK